MTGYSHVNVIGVNLFLLYIVISAVGCLFLKVNFLELPEIETFEPGENGESPLAKAYDWIETTCPCCGGKAQRETDTMPQWAGSSWYFLRYMDPHNDEALASKEALEYWSPVDWYNGGMEHTTLHLCIHVSGISSYMI